MVVNLSEKRYNGPLKFPTGKVVNAGWRTAAVTPLFLVLETVTNCLQYLQADPNHIIVIHCLDGKSNTAVLCCAILLACKFVTSFKDALKFFALKRCEALLDNFINFVLHFWYLLSFLPTKPIPQIRLSNFTSFTNQY